MMFDNVSQRLDISDDIVEHHGMVISGTDLKVERVRANVTILEVAARMGVSRQTVWGIERSARVSGQRAQEYRDALVTSDDVTSPENGAVA